MFELNIVTPNKKLVSGAEMEEVFVPAFRGELNILPGHSPLVSTLESGVLKYRLKESSELHAVAISWGYVEVTTNGVNILAESADSKADINTEETEQSLKALEKALEEAETPESIEQLQKEQRQLQAKKEVSTLH